MYSKVRGSRIGNTDLYNGVKPMMTLTDEIPADLDYDAYVDLAYRHLKELAY